MSRPARSADPRRRGSFGSLATFLVGVPLGAGLLFLIGEDAPLNDPTLTRYVEHPVEWAEVVLFCCAVCGLVGKFATVLRERLACRRDLLPSWDGKPLPTADAARLLMGLDCQPPRWRDTTLGRRLAAALGFVQARNSATGLDDHLRSLADADAMALDGTYSLLRFINWAIPILGFLGTVLGITQAIHGVTPEVLEQSLGQVTGGLATAFDTTALALLLTMILMFFTFLAERLEQGVLETVDAVTEAELSHRFVRNEDPTGGLMPALHGLVERQMGVWTQSVEKAERYWAQAGTEQQAKLAETLGHALEYALTRYGQRLAELEQSLIERHQATLDGLTNLVTVMRETGHEHQLVLSRLTDSLGMQLEAIGSLQVGEQKLIRLHESLDRNLTALASADTFEQAVQSLTAAIHLLTTRVAPQPATPRVFPRPEAA